MSHARPATQPYREQARERLDPAVFDFLDGAAGDGQSAADNLAAFARRRLVPRVLTDVSTIDLTTHVLGTPLASPLGVAPLPRLAGLRRRRLSQPAAVQRHRGGAEAVGADAEIHLDGGVRNASDVAIALALGARCVHLGRPLAFAVAVGGERAARALLEELSADLSTVLASLGARSIEELDPSHVVLADGTFDR